MTFATFSGMQLLKTVSILFCDFLINFPVDHLNILKSNLSENYRYYVGDMGFSPPPGIDEQLGGGGVVPNAPPPTTRTRLEATVSRVFTSGGGGRGSGHPLQNQGGEGDPSHPLPPRYV